MSEPERMPSGLRRRTTHYGKITRKPFSIPVRQADECRETAARSLKWNIILGVISAHGTGPSAGRRHYEPMEQRFTVETEPVGILPLVVEISTPACYPGLAIGAIIDLQRSSHVTGFCAVSPAWWDTGGDFNYSAIPSAAYGSDRDTARGARLYGRPLDPNPQKPDYIATI